ncbi:hypothetical protein CSAL01_13229 [Colletotrichum salicis]|uniref:Uncharacterized protein n=1 Tax=Colletotrichum salicis TaxID=1209931 RepID=A0A135S9T3_9PEZI|nr:hypothetical protein CSAL01_13229 [Colletotrichum salicis]
MSSSKPKPERPPTPSKPTLRSPNEDILLPSTLIDPNPFYMDMSQGTHRKALRPFTTTLTPLLRPRSSSEILADLQPEQNNPPTEHIPTPSRRPRIPKSPARTSPRTSDSSSDPSQDGFQTPERNHTTPVMRTFMDTSPAVSSGTSKRSVDVDGDIRMKNTTPETNHHALGALVTQIVHETFSLQRARLADEIRHQVLASLEQHIGQLVREHFEAALAEALEEPFEVGEGARARARAREAAVVRVVRERLAGLSCDGLVEVFCNEEVLGVLKKVVGVVEGEVCGTGWDLVAL